MGLELALVAIQKCLVLLHDYLGPNTKKLWLLIHTNYFDDMSLIFSVIHTIKERLIIVHGQVLAYFELRVGQVSKENYLLSSYI